MSHVLTKMLKTKRRMICLNSVDPSSLHVDIFLYGAPLKRSRHMAQAGPKTALFLLLQMTVSTVNVNQ